MFANFVTQIRRNEAGATLVEYGIAIILAVVVGTVGLLGLGGSINGNLQAASNELDVGAQN